MYWGASLSESVTVTVAVSARDWTAKKKILSEDDILSIGQWHKHTPPPPGGNSQNQTFQRKIPGLKSYFFGYFYYSREN